MVERGAVAKVLCQSGLSSKGRSALKVAYNGSDSRSSENFGAVVVIVVDRGIYS